MICLCPPGVAVLILLMTFLVTVLGTSIIGLILRIQKGKLQRQNGDIWWQIDYNAITILPQDKVRPHLAQTSTSLLTSGDLWKGPLPGAYENRGRLIYKVST